MANLETAIQLAKSNKKPTNQVLFAFWGSGGARFAGITPLCTAADRRWGHLGHCAKLEL